jgi:tRNA-binding EMAP/Myf-like protein
MASKQQPAMRKPQRSRLQKEEITFDDFTRMDLRVGKILEAEKVPKTKKLISTACGPGDGGANHCIRHR